MNCARNASTAVAHAGKAETKAYPQLKARIDPRTLNLTAFYTLYSYNTSTLFPKLRLFRDRALQQLSILQNPKAHPVRRDIAKLSLGPICSSIPLIAKVLLKAIPLGTANEIDKALLRGPFKNLKLHSASYLYKLRLSVVPHFKLRYWISASHVAEAASAGSLGALESALNQREGAALSLALYYGLNVSGSNDTIISRLKKYYNLIVAEDQSISDFRDCHTKKLRALMMRRGMDPYLPRYQMIAALSDFKAYMTQDPSSSVSPLLALYSRVFVYRFQRKFIRNTVVIDLEKIAEDGGGADRVIARLKKLTKSQRQ